MANLDMDSCPKPPILLCRATQTSPLTRRFVAIVSDIRSIWDWLSLDSTSGHTLNHHSKADVQGDGVEFAWSAAQPNDNFSMGAPPGAPGAI